MRTTPLSTLSTLVLDAQDSHSLSAIRSLGQLGARVTAVSPKSQAMGIASRYADRALRSPNPSTDPGAYAAWLLTTLAGERFDALLFFGEGSANVVAEHRNAIRALTGCLVPDHETFLTADRKDRIMRLAASIGVPVPATHELESAADASALMARLAFPVIVKGVWGSGGHQVKFVASAGEFVESVRQVSTLTPDGAPQRCLVQEYIPGVGYGFTALAEQGEVVAAFMHRRLAEHDVARGAQLAHAATGAESVDEPELRASGVALLRALCWDGMAMVEFRRSDRDGHFYLMEVNPRFPGSLGLAVAAGVDFPSLYVQRAAGRPVTVPQRYRVGLRYRWIVSKGVAEAVEDPWGYIRSAATVLQTDTRCDVSMRDPRPHVVQMREAAWWLRQYARGRAQQLGARGCAKAALAGVERVGLWFLRGRSYVPAGLLVATLLAMRGFTYPRGDHRLDMAWEAVCLFVSLVGLAVRIGAAGFGAADGPARTAHATLRTTGMYSIVRHPVHLGNILMWLGVAGFPRTWWLPVLSLAALWFYYERIMLAEDEAGRRRFGAAYTKWAAATPSLLPRLSQWKRPAGKFALHRVLEREPAALLMLITAFTLLEALGEMHIDRHLEVDAEWMGIFTATALAYATLSILKQRRYSRT